MRGTVLFRNGGNESAMLQGGNRDDAVVTPATAKKSNSTAVWIRYDGSRRDA